MASNDEPKPGPRRIRRTTQKAATADTASVEEEDSGVSYVQTAAARPRNTGRRALYGGRVRNSDITAFLRQLIMLLESGTPILRSLQTLSNRGERAAARALVADIAQYVEIGNPLWQSFDRHPQYFDSIFVNLIKASEASGTLTTVLRRVTEYRERHAMLTRRVKGAMIYPTLLVGACLGIMLLITKWVVPSFKEMFEEGNIKIPPFTQNFLKASEFVGNWWWLFPVVLIVLIALYLASVRSTAGRLRADRVKLSIPIFGPIIHKNALADLTRTLSLLLRSGLSMMSSLELTRNAVRNQAVAQTLQGVRNSIEQGGGMEEPLRECAPVIPPVVTDMLVTGEESGRVDAISEQIATIFEEEVRISVDSISEAVQPVFTVIVGIMVATLFVALFMPIVTMISQISGAGV